MHIFEKQSERFAKKTQIFHFDWKIILTKLKVFTIIWYNKANRKNEEKNGTKNEKFR